MSAVDVRLAISLELACEHADSSLYRQLASGKYDEMAVMPLPLTIAEYRGEHRTARNRADRCYGRGYRAGPLARERYANDIHKINLSAKMRQGRPMAAGYLERYEYEPLPDYPCERHATRISGVWELDTLVAYLVMIRAGELSLVSQILGHADHLDNGIMFLLFEEAISREIAADPRALVVYNRWDSGTDGLRTHKRMLGFEPMPVEWLP